MRRSILLSAAALTLAVLGGCSSSRSAPAASMGVMAPAVNTQVLTLGAGDTLGREVYINDLILAAAAYEPEIQYTNVDLGGSFGE